MYHPYCTVPCRLVNDTTQYACNICKYLRASGQPNFGKSWRSFIWLKKFNSNFSEILSAHLHSTFNGLYRLYAATSDRCLPVMPARSLGCGRRCPVPPALLYPAEEGFWVFPFATMCSLSLTLNACHSVRYSHLLPVAAFLLTSTYLTKFRWFAAVS